mgnify:FL=1
MLKKYFYKTALTTAALSTAVSVLLSGCGQSAGTGTAKTNTVTSAVSGLNMTAFYPKILSTTFSMKQRAVMTVMYGRRACIIL